MPNATDTRKPINFSSRKGSAAMRIKPKFSSRLFALATGVALTGLGVPTANALTLSDSPLFLAANAEPLTMIVMSKDHQLFYKAYTDWGDLDGDNAPDTTYKHSISYYGYFESDTCYDYNASATPPRFEPKAKSTTKYCDTVAGSWSGNFLNWATMARMDIVRKVLYGGYRSTDTASESVLERTLITTDAHSFAKFYSDSAELPKLTPFSGSSVTNGITVCNTTYYSGASDSQSVTSPPLMRVVKGDFRYWAANERWQCTWDDERGDNDNGTHTDPNRTTDGLQDGTAGPDFQVRTKVCVNSNDANGNSLLESNCKQYPSTNFKPTGLLHTFGEDGKALFGLLTGSFQKNKSGGVLRKNIASFANEVNAATNGTFTGVDGIVKTINTFRISRYHYGTGNNDGLYNTTDSCSWGLSSFTDGNCSNWGNPISEMYLEAVRYFAGQTATTAFEAPNDGTTYISGLTTAGWSSPITTAKSNWCASSNIIVLNASEISYDSDSLNMSGLNGTPNATTLTNTIGSATVGANPVENDPPISGHSFFVGENGTDNNQLCTAKSVTNLGDVKGTCPGSPRLSGTYSIAGISYWAHTTDVLPGVTGDATDTGQKLNTYGVQLSANLPKIDIPVPSSTTGQVVSILPACRNTSLDPDANCAIVDFKILSQSSTATTATGTFYVNWEDSEQGGDFDQDMKGTIQYTVNSVANTVSVTTDVNAQSTPNAMAFGYVISGTTKDGFHAHSGINNYNYNDPDAAITDCAANCNMADAATSYTYTLGTSSASFLKDPLWYAAKWGGFKDSDSNSYPNLATEWDAQNNQTGYSGSDGIPDNYFLVTNPAGLVQSLNNTFTKILKDTATGAAVAVNTASLNTESAVYQARFTSATWTGQLLAKRIDPVTGVVSNPTTCTVAGGCYWDAAAKVSAQNWDSGRQIITWDGTQGTAFRWLSLTAGQQSTLNAGGADTFGADRLKYLRGDSSRESQLTAPSFRARDGGNKLGDLIDSAPTYLGAPPFMYPDTFEDPTGNTKKYSDFRIAKRNRTPMIYVGGNDGMLHGFNACVTTSFPGCSTAADHGTERIAYVPASVYPNLTDLSNPSYGHRYYVDLTPTVGDVFGTFGTTKCGAGTECWRTILIGGLRAGGKGYFALDITDPSSFSEASAAQIAKWEFTDAADLGYTFSEVTIAKLRTGATTYQWVAVFGNGYNSTNGHAVLYLVDAITGTLIQKIDTDAGSDNGLSSPTIADVDGDFIGDIIYAGDLKGNLWKFTPDAAGTWDTYYKAGTTRKPLFAANDGTSLTTVAQPITSPPEIGMHPDGENGYMVYFGTGKYVETGDKTPSSSPIHSFYGIWDKHTNPTGGTPVARSSLLQQTITEYTDSSVIYRRVSTNTIQWDGITYVGPTIGTHKGWFVNLLTNDSDGINANNRGEMVIFRPILRSGRVIFTTLVPQDQKCSSGGFSWLMELDYKNGGALPYDVFDINGDGYFNSSDRAGGNIVSGVQTGTGITPTVTIIENKTDNTEKKLVTGTSASVATISENPGPTSDARRRSWRQIK
jgi:type IV pilus assembly protein PilY1